MEAEWFASWFDSRYYPLLYQNRGYEEAENFISAVTLFLKPKENARILDLACGRGRHSYFLHGMGYEVVGIDLSEKSIKEADELKKEGLEFFVHDMRKPFNKGKFDLILNLFTSFGYFDNDMENIEVLKNVKQALLPDGVFVLDFFNKKKILKNLVPAEKKEMSGVHFDIKRLYENGRINKYISIKEGAFETSFVESVRAFSKKEIESMLREADFSVFESWGAYDGSPFDPDTSARLILFARLS